MRTAAAASTSSGTTPQHRQKPAIQPKLHSACKEASSVLRFDVWLRGAEERARIELIWS